MATLSNKKNFYESVAALYSFCFWNKNVYLHYHEDGTLTEKEIGFLKKKFPGIKVFLRSDENIKVKTLLASKGLENCKKLRDVFFLSIKLFDMIVEKQTNYLLHIDSDVLFFSRPDEILDIVEKGNYNGCYNCDVSNSYTFDNETMSRYLTSEMIGRFNSGLILHNFDESFFNFINGVIEGNLYKTESWHLEQTLLAMFASEKGNFLGLPKHYDLARKEMFLGNKITSEHYVDGAGSVFHRDFINKLYPLFKRN
ncbi:glycosyltransferase [Mucilaginibacter sp.]|uniref:glycosyltransferase n=1 Tax=Mucilaginibacter sp. TaxID=1882438 RepID=UPI00260FB0B5|nr:glycosyltransferase [Mucilaginibacter sp.]